MPWLLNVLYLLGVILLSPYFLYRAIRTGRYFGSLRTRILGSIPPDVPRGAVWFHGVSVGEIHLLRQVVAAFRQRFPTMPVVVSATTDSGLAEARKAFADLPVIIFPLDFSWAVHRLLTALQPSLIVLAECELWPNFLLACRRVGVPVAIINARMSPRSFARYRLLGSLARWLLTLPDLWIVQNETFALSLGTLGVPAEQVHVGGAVKFDGAVCDRDNPRTLALRERFQIRPGEFVWVVGSTQAPEEAIALRIWQTLRAEGRAIRLILVPRHPERGDEIARLLGQADVPFGRWTQGTDAAAPVILIDTIGQLSAIWGLADLAFVGGSLDGKRGGQNMIEPAAYGAAVLFGPHVWNFAAIARNLLDARGAVQITSEEELLAEVVRLLDAPAERTALGRAGRQFVREQQGATARTLDILAEVLMEPTTSEAA